MFVHPGSNWNLEMLVFEERGKPEYSEKNLSEQSTEPTTNSTHIRQRGPGIEPRTHWQEASALATTPSLLPICMFLTLWLRDRCATVFFKMPGSFATKIPSFRLESTFCIDAGITICLALGEFWLEVNDC